MATAIQDQTNTESADLAEPRPSEPRGFFPLSPELVAVIAPKTLRFLVLVAECFGSRPRRDGSTVIIIGLSLIHI